MGVQYIAYIFARIERSLGKLRSKLRSKLGPVEVVSKDRGRAAVNFRGN